jgi:hypothetical protein
MIRLHNSNIELIDLNRKYAQKGLIFKPKGVWYSIDNEWLDWCINEMPHWIKQNIFDLEIDINQILNLKTKKDVLLFNKKYKTTPFNEKYISYIDWELVSNEYKGIEIQNYHQIKWGITDKIWPTWFYGWDISGGCLWDLSVIKGIKKMKTSEEYLKLLIVND